MLRHQLNNIKSRITCLLLGFLVATVLSTIPGQTGEWSVIAAAIIITSNEIVSKLVYQAKRQEDIILVIINDIKIGIIYGLFVDAFKLGS
uniref:hypothetical protein n=1 Tax=Catenella fusiformis TaxID=3024791 RepID=UPI0027DA203F|nr:hypothetical protein REQ04_pgp140 [Catenella fusiformis]WCH57487.1 hypothetical protein [Catenella fusiformis]